MKQDFCELERIRWPTIRSETVLRLYRPDGGSGRYHLGGEVSTDIFRCLHMWVYGKVTVNGDLLGFGG